MQSCELTCDSCDTGRRKCFIYSIYYALCDVVDDVSPCISVQLSHYLDVVEIQIAEQISRRSEAFFDAMISHDELQDHMRRTCDVIGYLRYASAYTFYDTCVVSSGVDMVYLMY